MRARQGGLTLVETLVALGLLGLIFAFTVPALLGNTSVNRGSEVRSQAATALRRVMDQTRAQDPSSLPRSGSSAPQTVEVGGRRFQVTLDYCHVAAYCSDTARSLRARAVLDNRPILAVETVFTSVSSTIGAAP